MAETPKPTGVGFKFNSTGTDETSTDIIEPKVDSETRTRRALLIGAILVAVVGLLLVSFIRNPVTLDDLLNRRKGPIFQPPTERRAE